MKATVGIAKSLTKREYELVINDEFYIKISRSMYYEVKKYMKEKKNDK